MARVNLILEAIVHAADVDGESWYDASVGDGVQGEAGGHWHDAIGEEYAPRGGKICDNAGREDSVSDQECTDRVRLICDEKWSYAIGEEKEKFRNFSVLVLNLSK